MNHHFDSNRLIIDYVHSVPFQFIESLLNLCLTSYEFLISFIMIQLKKKQRHIWILLFHNFDIKTSEFC